MHQNKKGGGGGGGGNPAGVTPDCVMALMLTDYQSPAGRMRQKIVVVVVIVGEVVMERGERENEERRAEVNELWRVAAGKTERSLFRPQR